MRRWLAALVLAVVFVAPLAEADQCQLVDAEIAGRAVAAIRTSHGRVLSYCAPCGDPDPVASAARMPHTVVNSGSSVLIDGTEVDLAYTYLEVAPNVFENVALRTGCPAQEVPEVLRFAGGRLTRGRFGRPPASLVHLGWGHAPPPASQRLPPPG